MSRLTLCVSLIISFLLFTIAPVSADDDLNLPKGIITDGPQVNQDVVRDYLLRQAEHEATRWRAEYDKLNTPEEIAAYQKRMRENVLKAIGGLPERTPLEPRITGTVERPGYSVEKVLFQSRPKHYVTALLFLPDAERFEPPYPGVLIPCGHSKNGKGRDVYQTAGALFALNGMAALVFDPIDQGERGQYLGPGGWPKLASVGGHLMVGVGSILLGQNTARFEIWDGMRAIDYLQSRPEVDPRLIGCTGCSGGGTQTCYLTALDDRIRAAAPSCYVTSFPRLLSTIGPQDAEQNLFGQLTFPMDHADWLMMRAPAPVLVLAATRDFFDIGGTWDTFRDAKRLYTRMGLAANLDILETDGKHGYDRNHREGAARWMSRWLLGKDKRIVEPTIELLSEEEYHCLPDGKVMTLPGARSVYDLNEGYENELSARRAAAWKNDDKTALLDRVRRLSGVRELTELPKPRVETLGEVVRNNVGGKGPHPNPLPKGEGTYRIEKLLIRADDGVPLPALLFLPEKPKVNRVAVYVHSQGKSADARPGGPIEKLVLDGLPVLAVDLRGTGQTAPTGEGSLSPEWRNAYIAYLLGRSYVGMRAEDILVCTRYAAERFAAGRPESVDLIAVGNVGVPALHAAALEPQLFRSVRISRSLRAWSDIIHQRLSKDQLVNTVHAALTHYDLPELAATLADKLTTEQPVDAMGDAVLDDR